MGRPNSLQALWTLTRFRMATHYKSGEFMGPRIGDKLFAAVIILTLYWDIGAKETQAGQQTTAALFYFVAALCVRRPRRVSNPPAAPSACANRRFEPRARAPTPD